MVQELNGGFIGVFKDLLKKLLQEQGFLGALLLVVIAIGLGWIPSRLRTAIEEQSRLLRAICYRLPDAKIPCEDFLRREGE